MEQQQQKCRMHAQPQGRDAWWTLVGFIEQLPVRGRARRPQRVATEHARLRVAHRQADGARPLPPFYARARARGGLWPRDRRAGAMRQVVRLGFRT